MTSGALSCEKLLLNLELAKLGDDKFWNRNGI